MPPLYTAYTRNSRSRCKESAKCRQSGFKNLSDVNQYCCFFRHYATVAADMSSLNSTHTHSWAQPVADGTLGGSPILSLIPIWMGPENSMEIDSAWLGAQGPQRGGLCLCTCCHPDVIRWDCLVTRGACLASRSPRWEAGRIHDGAVSSPV